MRFDLKTGRFTSILTLLMHQLLVILLGCPAVKGLIAHLTLVALGVVMLLADVLGQVGLIEEIPLLGFTLSLRTPATMRLDLCRCVSTRNDAFTPVTEAFRTHLNLVTPTCFFL